MCRLLLEARLLSKAAHKFMHKGTQQICGWQLCFSCEECWKKIGVSSGMQTNSSPIYFGTVILKAATPRDPWVREKEAKRENGNEVRFWHNAHCRAPNVRIFYVEGFFLLPFARSYEMMMMCMPASVFNESQNHFQSSGNVHSSFWVSGRKF